MTNIQTTVEGDILTIKVNLKERHGLSSSGKTVSVASTHGNAKLPGKHANISFGLNVYTKDGVDSKAKAA